VNRPGHLSSTAKFEKMNYDNAKEDFTDFTDHYQQVEIPPSIGTGLIPYPKIITEGLVKLNDDKGTNILDRIR
jgi:hypothetical protein